MVDNKKQRKKNEIEIQKKKKQKTEIELLKNYCSSIVLYCIVFKNYCSVGGVSACARGRKKQVALSPFSGLKCSFLVMQSCCG